MKDDTGCGGVDVAKSTLDPANSNSREIRQCDNAHKGIIKAVRFISDLKPNVVFLVATGHFEITLAAELQRVEIS